MPYRFNSAKFRHIMQQPGWWAAVSSLGFHGLIFLVLSLLPAPPSLGDDLDSSRTVSVVELSAGQAGRLPNFTELETTLPPLPEPIPGASLPAPEDFTFDLGPNIVESQRDFNLAPRTSATYDFSDLLSNLPPPETFSRRRPIVVPRRTRSLPPPTPIQPAPTRSFENAPPVEPEPSAEDLRPEGSPTPDESDTAEEPTPTAPQQTARASQPRPPQGIQLSEEQQERYDQLFSYNPDGTSGRAAQDAALAWFTETLGRDIEDIDRLRDFLTLQVEYPADTCGIGAEEGDLAASYGVVLDEDGAASERPVLIRSSGYPVLNLVGRDAVEAAGSFSEATGPRLVRVDFVYSDATCAAAEAIARDSASPNVAAPPAGDEETSDPEANAPESSTSEASSSEADTSEANSSPSSPSAAEESASAEPQEAEAAPPNAPNPSQPDSGSEALSGPLNAPNTAQEQE